MLPGHHGQDILVKLAEDKSSKNKARNFNRAVSTRGFALRVAIAYLSVVGPSGCGTVRHPILPIQDMAKEIFRNYEEKLFAGRSVESAHGGFLRDSGGHFDKFSPSAKFSKSIPGIH